MTLTVEEPDVLDVHALDRAGAAGVSILAAVTGGATGGFDPVLGGIIGTVILTTGTIAVAVIGKSSKATPPPAHEDEDRVSVPRDSWEQLVRESAQWRVHQEEQAELRELRDDR